MKSCIILFFLMILFGSNLKAQLNNLDSGDVAPDFTVTDPEGNSYTLSQITGSGKYVLIDFFGYWCGSCRTKAPIVQSFYNKYGCNEFDVFVIGIECDGNNAQLYTFDTLVNLPDPHYPSVSGAEGGGSLIKTTYGVASFPTLVAIGPDRKVIDENIFPSNNAFDLFSGFQSDSISANQCLPNAVEIIPPSEFNISPNPSSKVLHIQNTSAQTTTYRILDLKGFTVLKGELSSSSINIESLRNGIYWILFSGEKPLKLIVINP